RVLQAEAEGLEDGGLVVDQQNPDSGDSGAWFDHGVAPCCGQLWLRRPRPHRVPCRMHGDPAPDLRIAMRQGWRRAYKSLIFDDSNSGTGLERATLRPPPTRCGRDGGAAMAAPQSGGEPYAVLRTGVF